MKRVSAVLDADIQQLLQHEQEIRLAGAERSYSKGKHGDILITVVYVVDNRHSCLSRPANA